LKSRPVLISFLEKSLKFRKTEKVLVNYFEIMEGRHRKHDISY